MCSDTVAAAAFLIGFVNIWQSVATDPLREDVQKRHHRFFFLSMPVNCGCRLLVMCHLLPRKCGAGQVSE